MEHDVNGYIKIKKRKIDYKIRMNASLLNLYDFNQLDMKICDTGKVVRG